MRILIVEDEPLVRQRLLRLCQEHTNSRARYEAVDCLADADECLRGRTFDGLLLDLNLAGQDGFHLLRKAVAGSFHTVVVSAHAERALEAFELGVLDFVAKPFTRERLAQALERLLEAGQQRAGHTKFLAVWRPTGIATIAVEQVMRVQADGDYSRVTLASGRDELHEKSLDRLGAILSPAFVRCHRSWMVNLHYADCLKTARGSRSELVMKDGASVPVGRSRLAALRAMLG